MADIGVMFGDGGGVYYNPAVIGLPSEGRWHLPLTLTPNMYGSQADFYAFSLALRPTKKSHQGVPSIGVAARFKHLDSGPMVERTYSRGLGTGRTFRWKDYKAGATIGLGWSGKVDFSLGLSINWVGGRASGNRADVVADDWISIIQSLGGGYKAEVMTVDLGAFMRIPVGTPGYPGFQVREVNIGASFSNIGPDLKFIEKTAPLPKIGRLGAAVEISRLDDNGRVQFAILPAMEYELNTTGRDEGTMKMGLEAAYRQIIYGRVGTRSRKSSTSGYRSYGFSLSTLGLRNGGGEDSSGETGFSRSLVLEFHYGRISSGGGSFDGTNHFGLSLTL
jgi:hypothetical protein